MWEQIRRQVRARLPWVVWLIIVTGASLFLITQPLLRVLSYEYSFIMAGVLSLAGVHLGALTSSRWRRFADDPAEAKERPSPEGCRSGLSRLPLGKRGGEGRLDGGRAVSSLYWSALWPVALLWVVALDIPWAYGAAAHRCNTWLGFAFYVVLAGVSVLVSVAVGVAAGLLARGRVTSALLGFAVVLGSWGFGVYKFYSRPPVCVYDPFLGYFSGNFYDALLLLEAPLIWARLFHLTLGLALLATAARFLSVRDRRLTLRADARGGEGRPRSRRRLAWLAAAVWAAAVGLGAFHGKLGFSLDTKDIGCELSGVVTTPHFRIYFPTDGMTTEDAVKLALDAEFRHHQLEKFFGTAPDRRITVFVFRDSLQKKRLMGAHQVDMAKPWRTEIYITKRSVPHSVMKHELAHVFAGTFGDPLFGVSFRWKLYAGLFPVPAFSPGLIEGAAVAADWSGNGLTAHQRSKAMLELDIAPPLEAVMGYSFFASAAVRSYSMAGSFCRFLVERYGPDRFRRVFRSGGAFERVYGKKIGELEEEWKAYLAKVPLSAEKKAVAERVLQRRSVFQRVCIHRIASLKREARKGSLEEAIETYDLICSLDPFDPGHFLTRLYYESAAGKYEDAWVTAAILLHHPALTKPVKAYVLRGLGNMEWRRKNLSRARRLFELAYGLPNSRSTKRDLLARLHAVRDDEIEPVLQKVLLRWDRSALEDLYRLSEERPGWGLGPYLIGSIHRQTGKLASAARYLRMALARKLPSRLFRLEGLERLGKTLYVLQKHTEAEEVFRKLEEVAGSRGLELTARDWIDRCRWARAYRAELEAKIEVRKIR